MAYFPPNKQTYANVTIANGSYTIGNLTGASGASLTYSTGSGGVPLWTNATTATAYYPKQPKVQITDSDIEIDGLSLKATLKTLHERLAIMIPNPALEKEFEELKACGDEYRRLERQFEEQLKMWNTLKSTDNK